MNANGNSLLLLLLLSLSVLLLLFLLLSLEPSSVFFLSSLKLKPQTFFQNYFSSLFIFIVYLIFLSLDIYENFEFSVVFN